MRAARTLRIFGGGEGATLRDVFFAEAIQALTDAGASFCVVGGLAVSLHGVPRTTYDVDVVVALDAQNLTRVDAALRALGLAPKLPIDLVALADYLVAMKPSAGRPQDLADVAHLERLLGDDA